jgi:hypothetical protein
MIESTPMKRSIFALLLMLLPVSQAQADSARRVLQAPLAVAVPDGPEGVGCYYERGRSFCSRYCYVEVNGRRYCRTRAREAHSQAPAVDVLPVIAAPMK